MYEGLQRAIAAGCAAVFMLGGAEARAAEAPQEPLRLMCLGDSITDGFWMAGGYRNTLGECIQADGLSAQIDFVGPNWGGSCYDPQHAGYSGYSIDNIAQEDSISGGRTGISSFSKWLMETYPADVVFMQIGTNDILSLYDLAHFGERLEKLADGIEETLPPDGMLYLATLPVMDATNNLYISEYFFTVESMDEAVSDCNAQIRALAEKMQGEGRRVQLAEVNQVLTKADLYDGVHPSEEGYEKLGRFWYGKLTAYLNGETAAETDAPVPQRSVRGDVNGSGKLEIADAVLLGKHLAGETPLTEAQAARAEMNGDGKLTAADFTLVKRAMLQ